MVVAGWLWVVIAGVVFSFVRSGVCPVVRGSSRAWLRVVGGLGSAVFRASRPMPLFSALPFRVTFSGRAVGRGGFGDWARYELNRVGRGCGFGPSASGGVGWELAPHTVLGWRHVKPKPTR